MRDFSHGQSVSLVRELADYWRDGFDWRAQEARLNTLPQFTTEIDGQTLHFLHVKSPETEAFPLILTHGWPSSPAEYLDHIGPLTDPRGHGRGDGPAFDPVIPSVPAMGLSSPLAAAGWDAARTAAAWDTLMKRLGYERYGAQGGDGGALVARELGILAPAGLAGVHVQQIFAFPTGAPDEMQGLTPFERAGFERLDYFRKYAGYVDIQSKRPGTLAFGLVDSPAALLAWNAELFFGFAGDEILSIAFKTEVYMPRLPGRLMVGRGVVCPVDRQGRFHIGEERFEIPRFDNAEQLVMALARQGVLERDPVVLRAMQGARQRLDERSIQRHFAEVAGLGLKTLQQIARAHQAAELLRQGITASQVAAELGFSDQAHMSHSLKRLLGRTPREIAQGGPPAVR